jgi:chromate reductase
MKVMNVPRLTVPNAWQQLDGEGKLQLKESILFLQKQADAFLDFLQGK